MKSVHSRANPSFLHLRALATGARMRAELGRTLLEGPHLIAEYVRRCGLPRQLAVSEAALTETEIAELLAACAKTPQLFLPQRLFAQLSDLATPMGILAEIDIPAEPPPTPGAVRCVALDAVQDAGNVGAILRSAAAAGVQEAILGHGCASPWSPRVLRAAQGAHFALTIRQTDNLAAHLCDHQRQGGRVAATVTAEGQSLYALKLAAAPLCWLFGNEGAGVAPELANRADLRVTIPLASAVESLNVAAAAAVCLFEARRQILQTAA